MYSRHMADLRLQLQLGTDSDSSYIQFMQKMLFCAKCQRLWSSSNLQVVNKGGSVSCFSVQSAAARRMTYLVFLRRICKDNGDVRYGRWSSSREPRV